MSTLEKQVIQSIYGLPDEQLKVVLDVIQGLNKPKAQAADKKSTAERRLGIFGDEKLVADGYNLDDCNDEIAELFGVG